MLQPYLRRCIFFSCLLLLSWCTSTESQENRGPFKVIIKDGKAVVGEATLPLDPNPRIVAQFSSSRHFGLTLEGKRITCSPAGSIWSTIFLDGSVVNPFAVFNNPKIILPDPLPPTATGKKRLGTQSTWNHAGIRVTQIVEIVPSKSSSKAPSAGQKRVVDTCRISYLLENVDQRPHKVAYKACIDILIVNNDGALFASPTTAPGKILNGVALKDKEIPEYLWVLERPDLANPGFVATMTLKHAKGENPNKVVLSNLTMVSNFMRWDVHPAPAGDSACAIFWEEKELQPGQKRELVFGYGGGISTSTDSEGQLKIGVSGAFEPRKLFTIVAQVDDPSPDQALALELPPGIERVEGAEIQPVPLPGDSGSSLVLWKARVTRIGDYEISIRSSTGAVKTKHISVQPAGTK